MLFSEWCQIFEHPCTTDVPYIHYISHLQQSGLLKGDDITDHFFRILMVVYLVCNCDYWKICKALVICKDFSFSSLQCQEISVAHCVASEVIIPGSLLQSPQVQNISFISTDMFARLVVEVLKVIQFVCGSREFLAAVADHVSID